MKFDKFTDVCMTGGITYTPSPTNVCKFFVFQLTFSQLILKVLVYVFYFNLFEFSAAILEKGLL